MSDSELDMPSLSRRARGESDPRRIGNWKIGRVIGQGSSGRVRIARNAKTGQYAAVKIVSKNTVFNSHMTGVRDLGEEAEQILLGIEREIVIMKLIEHPNIMRLYDVWETSTELFLILEYVEGGELFEYLCNKGRLATPEALGYFQQIIFAVDYCHRFNIAHRDLKPENLLLDKDMNIKVADFGMAAWQVGNRNGLLQTACGSPHYAAPEVIRGEAYNGSISDIWSCGVVLHALLVGRLPFDDDDLFTLLEKIKTGRFIMPSIDPLAQDLIARMLDVDVESRITMDGILAHPFFVSQPPKQMRDHSMPDLTALARPVGGLSDIDVHILGNMRTLWHGIPDDEIIERLTNDEQNWEKGVYHLLSKYRAKRMKEIDPAEGQRKLRSKRKSKKEKAIATPAIAGPSSSTPNQKASRNRRVIPRMDTPQPEDFPPRAAPPTPRRSSEKYANSAASSGEFVQVLSKTMDSLSLDDTWVPLDHAPKSFFSEEPWVTDFADGFADGLADGLISPPLPPLPESGPSPISPTIPIWEELKRSPLPADDENVQHFLRQVEQQLQIMDRRRPATPDPDDVVRDSHFSPRPKTGEFGVAVGDDETQTDAPPIVKRIARRPAPLVFDANAGKENPHNARRDQGPVSARVPLSNLKVHAVESSEDVQGRKKKISLKQRQDKRPIDGLPTPPASASPAKPSWFTNPFKSKAATYNLLSRADKHASFLECRRIFLRLGVSVADADADPVSADFTLRCSVDDIQDAAGATVRKAVAFRVEMHRPNCEQNTAGFEVELAFVYERGALATFKHVLKLLRREWVLDSVMPPPMNGGARSAPAGNAKGNNVRRAKTIRATNPL